MKRLFANLIPSMYPTLPISIPATMAQTTNERFQKKKRRKKKIKKCTRPILIKHDESGLKCQPTKHQMTDSEKLRKPKS